MRFKIRVLKSGGFFILQTLHPKLQLLNKILTYELIASNRSHLKNSYIYTYNSK